MSRLKERWIGRGGITNFSCPACRISNLFAPHGHDDRFMCGGHFSIISEGLNNDNFLKLGIIEDDGTLEAENFPFLRSRWTVDV